MILRDGRLFENGRKAQKSSEKAKMDALGIEPNTSRKSPRSVLSERDNQLHHVPSMIRLGSAFPVVITTCIGTTESIRTSVYADGYHISNNKKPYLTAIIMNAPLGINPQ